MTASDDTASRLSLLEQELALSGRVDDVLEGALRERLPLEAYVGTLLGILADATGATGVALRTIDENLETATFSFPEAGGIDPALVERASTATSAREAFVDRSEERTVLAEHLDVAGELFGMVAIQLAGTVDGAQLDRARSLVHVFAETIDNQLAFIAVFRQKSLVARELGDALVDPVLDRGIDAALEVLRRSVQFDDLLLVVRDEHAAHGARLTYRIVQGGVLTHEAAVTGEVSVDDFIKKHAATMIHGDSRSLLAKLGITRFREEALIQGVRDKRVLGKLVVTSRRGELSTFDRDVLERFCDILRQRLIDHAREWNHLALSFPRPVVERLLAFEGYDTALLSPRERAVAILYADLSGFSRISEQVLKEPEKIAKLVDTWSQRAVEAIFSLGGVFDKMVGDCIIALFGPPFFDCEAADVCERAIEAAERIRDLTRKLGEGREIPELAGLSPPLGVATGIHYGRVFVGRVGPDENYTAFGSVMNNAARLQGLATRDQILCMKDLVDAVGGGPRFADERSSLVKNVTEPIRYRELLPVVG